MTRAETRTDGRISNAKHVGPPGAANTISLSTQVSGDYPTRGPLPITADHYGAVGPERTLRLFPIVPGDKRAADRTTSWYTTSAYYTICPCLLLLLLLREPHAL